MISYCVFNVGERRIGIAMTSVREIIDHQLVTPTPIPLTPPFVHGLFNLRGQVLPHLDLSPFVGAESETAPIGRGDRAIIVERGQFRFATTGRRIDTIEADPAQFQPLDSAAIHPALDAQAHTDRGNFETIHLDRLEACLAQALKTNETPGTTPVPNAPTGDAATPTQDQKPQGHNTINDNEPK